METSKTELMQMFQQFYEQHVGVLDPARRDCVPDFLIISPPKTGTTWLAENLRQHPDIFLPEEKELHYFSAYWRHFDINWYLKFFEGAAHLAKGEASTGYGALPRFAVEFIYRFNPKLKLIYLMRHPAERTWSQGRHRYKYGPSAAGNHVLGADPDEDILAHIDSEVHYHSGYVRDLRCWLSVFPAEQLYVGFYETIRTDPLRLLAGVFAHLGARPIADWTRFPVLEVIHPGIEYEIPESVALTLNRRYRRSARELAGFLRTHFSLELPSSWREITDGTDGAVTAEGESSPESWPEAEENPYQTGQGDPFFDPRVSEHVLAPPLFYREFNCVFLLYRWYAFSASLGDVDVRTLDDHALNDYVAQGQCFIGNSLDEIKQSIEQVSHESSPKLIEAAYRGFNLVAYRGQVFGLALSLGPMNPTQIDSQTFAKYQARGECFVGTSVDGVKRQIEEAGLFSLKLLEADYQGLNVVEPRGRLYGLALWLGRWTFLTVVLRRFMHIKRAASVVWRFPRLR